MNSYFRIRLSRVPAVLEQEITHLCFKSECLGISEALQFVQKNLQYDPDLIHTRVKDFDVYFDKQPGSEFFSQVKGLSDLIQTSIHEEEHKDWLEEWKKGFEPFPLVGNYWVVPSWREVPQEAAYPIRIDPGMAFGTGTHATTQLAASLIFKILSKNPKPEKWDVLDVGTGTAILAMLAKSCGAQMAVGIEIDPEARRVAKENVRLNKCEDVLILDDAIEEIRTQFDLVIANIIDGVLIQIKNDLLRVTKPGGYLILTGILTEREDYFFEKFMTDAPVEILRRVVKDEWIGFLMKVKSSEE